MPSRRRSTAKGTTRDKATDASALERELVVTHRLICARCGTEYRLRLGPGPDDYSYLDKTGPAGSECVYHWGKAWKTKATRSRTWETRYTCCRADIGAPGCTLARAHVTDDVTTTLGPASFESGWVRTRPPRPGRGTPAATRPFALDCEMVYTPWGPELARVTVVGYDGTTAYESMVRPSHSSVVDYNTRFSGITEAMLAGNDVRSLDQVQADILDLVPASAILIGHSLESDLVVLKMVHLTVVDTSVVFPHRLGAPYKRALKNLMSEHLKRIIQDDVDGHDSREDAAACMELMKWKVKHDMPKTNA